MSTVATKQRYILIGEDGPVSERVMTDSQFDSAQAKISSLGGEITSYWEIANVEQGHCWADSKRTGE